MLLCYTLLTLRSQSISPSFTTHNHPMVLKVFVTIYNDKQTIIDSFIMHFDITSLFFFIITYISMPMVNDLYNFFESIRICFQLDFQPFLHHFFS
jgi:hypothetical protein